MLGLSDAPSSQPTILSVFTTSDPFYNTDQKLVRFNRVVTNSHERGRGRSEDRGYPSRIDEVWEW